MTIFRFRRLFGSFVVLLFAIVLSACQSPPLEHLDNQLRPTPIAVAQVENRAASSPYFQVQFVGNWFYALKRQPPPKQPLLDTVHSLDEPSTERVLIDPNQMDPAGTTSIKSFKVSPDGATALIWFAKAGTEKETLRLYDVNTAQPSPDSLPSDPASWPPLTSTSGIAPVFRIIAPDGSAPLNKRAIGRIFGDNREFMSGFGGGTDQAGEIRHFGSGLPPGRYKFACIVFGVGYALQEFVIHGGFDVLTVDVRLNRGASISGTVVEEKTLQPAGGELLQLWGVFHEKTPNWTGMLHWRHNLSALPPILQSDSTSLSISRDGNGRFVLQNLPPGQYAVVPFSELEWAYGSSPWKFNERFTLSEGQSITNVQIVVPALSNARSVSGVLFRANTRSPLANAEINLRVAVAEEGPNIRKSMMPSDRIPAIERMVRTDAKGRFRLYPLKPQTYVISVVEDGKEKSDPARVDVRSQSIEDLNFVSK